MEGNKKEAMLGTIAVGILIVYLAYTHYKKFKEEEETVTVEDLKDILKSDAYVESKLKSTQHHERVKDALIDSYTDDEEYEDEIVSYSDGVLTVEDNDIRKPVFNPGYIPQTHINTTDKNGGEITLLKGTDVNSDNALTQFINMQTADVPYDSKVDKTLRRLFDFAFQPVTDRDKDTLQSLKYERQHFFSENSKWIEEVTWADLLLHFARRTAINIGMDTEHWVAIFVNHLDLSPSMNAEDVLDKADMLVAHEYINNDTGAFGLFGLDDNGCSYMLKNSNKFADTNYSFEMEFNAYLNMLMED